MYEKKTGVKCSQHLHWKPLIQDISLFAYKVLKRENQGRRNLNVRKEKKPSILLRFMCCSLIMEATDSSECQTLLMAGASSSFVLPDFGRHKNSHTSPKTRLTRTTSTSEWVNMPESFAWFTLTTFEATTIKATFHNKFSSFIRIKNQGSWLFCLSGLLSIGSIKMTHIKKVKTIVEKIGSSCFLPYKKNPFSY